MNASYIYTTHIGLRDADAAGVLFFARYYTLAHAAYEAFMEERGIGFGSLFRAGTFMIPVVHSECDYRASLWVGEQVTVEMTVVDVRRRKFSLEFAIKNSEGRLAATVRTDHMVIDQETHKSIPLPEVLQMALRGKSTADG